MATDHANFVGPGQGMREQAPQQPLLMERAPPAAAAGVGGRAKISNSVSKGMQDDAREVVRTTFNPFSMLFQMRYVRTRCSDLLYYFLYHLCLYSNIFTDIFTVFRRFHM